MVWIMNNLLLDTLSTLAEAIFFTWVFYFKFPYHLFSFEGNVYTLAQLSTDWKLSHTDYSCKLPPLTWRCHQHIIKPNKQPSTNLITIIFIHIYFFSPPFLYHYIQILKQFTNNIICSYVLIFVLQYDYSYFSSTTQNE